MIFVYERVIILVKERRIIGMKNFVIWLIKIYKKIPGPWHGMCKYYPTCSSYAIEAIEKYGLINGGWLAIKRICRCNPFAKPGYDPVPKNDKYVYKMK